MSIKQLTQNSRGDTIVEVLIAILVASFILGGAYVTANHSLNNIRQAEERSEALKYVQEQLERIKSQADSSSGSAVFSIPSPFCMDASTNNPVPVTPAACQRGGVPYSLSVTRTKVSSSGTTTTWSFAVTAAWERSGGGGNDQIIMYYKADQDT